MINIFNKLLPFLLVILMPVFTLAQIESTDYYTPGEQDMELMIIVHVWGEVNKPGKFIVRDGSNLVEILSEAGGPTRYANLKNVYIAHKGDQTKHIEIYNLEKTLSKPKKPFTTIIGGSKISSKINVITSLL